MKRLRLTFRQFSFAGVAMASIVVLFLLSCTSRSELIDLNGLDSIATKSPSPMKMVEPEKVHLIAPRDIAVKDHFSFMDSLVNHYKSGPLEKLDEYALVLFNPGILDSLRNTDYYIQKKKGNFLYDQAKAVVIHQGDTIHIPNCDDIASIHQKLDSTIIDVNIPEYRLRILQGNDTILNCKVRVGRNDTAYLPLIGHTVDLKTPIGKGEIIRVEKKPTYVNPDTGEKFDQTKRDDGRVTMMPVIPWIEPTINGTRFGSMIHPTTNPRSLGKAISHGCIGTTEADAWTIFYHAPIGTSVIFRYNLTSKDRSGKITKLRDIYHQGSK